MFARQIEEIRADRALVLYGVALAAANLITFAHWKFKVGVPLLIGHGAEMFCWPFLESCRAWQLPVFVVNYGLWAYALACIVAGGFFLTHRISSGYWLLLAVNVVRLLVMLQDYRLRANQHYMLNWVVLAFLFLPGKRALIHHVLASLYFWAGVLKLDRDWLSGAALYSQDRLWFPRELVAASCVYVVALEMGLIWGIYARRRWLFYGTLAQLILFHITSWPIVGFWYPLLMFCLLTILPLSRLFASERIHAIWPWHGTARQLALTASVMGLFGALQMIPRVFPGDTALTGEGRVFALHMFDALVECEAALTYRASDGSLYTDSLQESRKLPHRSRCDPLIYFNIAKNRCARLRDGRQIVAHAVRDVMDLDLSLWARRNSDPRFHQIVDIERFCSVDPSYDVWRHNSWIRTP